MSAPVDHWNAVYARGVPLPWDLPALPDEIAAVLDSLGPASRVLDVGCGRGQHALRIAARGYRVTGVDVSAEAIRQAAAAGVHLGFDVRFVCADATLFVADEPFDLAVDYSVLHHVDPDRRAAYGARLADNVRPGGQLLVVCYAESDPSAAGGGTRVGSMGNVIHHLGRSEICRTFERGFAEVAYGTTSLGQRRQHPAHRVTFRRR